MDVDDRCWGRNLLVILDKFEMQKTKKRGNPYIFGPRPYILRQDRIIY